MSTGTTVAFGMERLSFTPHCRISDCRSFESCLSGHPDDDALRAILAAVETLLPSPDRWETPGSYDSVGLAVIAAVWSIGVRYQSVDNVIARYRAERLAGGGDPEADGPGDVRRFIEACGGAEEFAQRMGNRQRTSTTNGILKAEAVLHEARILEDDGVELVADLTAASPERLDHLQGRWSTVAGRAPASRGARSRCSSASPRSSRTA